MTTTDRVAQNGHVTDRAGNCRTCPENHGADLLPADIRPTAARRITIEQSVEQCKKEIIEGLKEGTFSFYDIKEFGDLHSYWDANTLGWLCDGDDGSVIFVDAQGEITDHDDDGEGESRWMEFGNVVQEQVHQWILAKGHWGTDVEEIVKALREERFDAHVNGDHGPTEIDIFVDDDTVVNLCRWFNRENGGWEAQADRDGDVRPLEDGPDAHASVEDVVSWVQEQRDLKYPQH